MSTTDLEKQQKITEKNLNKLKHLEEQAKPLWIARQFVDRPCVVMGICSIFFLLCTILTITQNFMDQSTSADREWLVWSEEKVQDWDIWEESKEVFKKENEDEQVPVRSIEIESWGTSLMLECWKDADSPCDNVLTAKYVNILLSMERQIMGLKNYEQFCLASTASAECSEDAINSITTLFTANERKNGITQDALDAYLDQILDENIFSDWSYLFGKEFSKNNKKTRYLQSLLQFGGPLDIDGKRYKDQYDDEEKQEDKFVKFSEKMIKIIDEQNDKNKDGLMVLALSGTIADLRFQEIINSDFLWALASILFVWCYLTFHLRSFFLSSFAIFNIVMSFPLTLFIFRMILQVDYFSSLHILVIFVVLGIAADDVFVFIDAWNQTKQIDFLKNDLHKRMAVTFRRAAKAMLATSSTTAAAFLATGMSSLMPISSFGIFAGILVPMNFILVITFFPPVLILQQKYLIGRCCPCQKRKEKKQDQKVDTKYVREQQSAGVAADGEVRVPVQIDNNNANILEEEDKKHDSKVEIFFNGPYNNFIYKGRFIILAIIFIWQIASTIMALQLGPQTKPDQWLPDSYELQRQINHMSSDMHSSGAGGVAQIEVTFIWGIKSINIEDVAAWDSEDRGKLVYDKSFSLEEPDNQEYLLKVCNDLKKESIVQDEEVNCFMESFKEWVEHSDGKNESFPVDQSDFLNYLKEFVDTPIGQEYSLEGKIGIIDNKLQYVAIQAISEGNDEESYIKKEKIEAKWEKIESKINKAAPKGLRNGIELSPSWAWMVSEKAFVTNAINGMAISIAFAFLVLLISTHNIVVSIYSIVCILGIVTSVVSVMWMIGWQLGVAESITIVILIGFSVDYVVHLSNHYVESSHDDKYSRIQEALKEIGISIISGSITTLGAGLFLFFAVVSIFNKFAVLIVATILFSLVFSLLYFASLMHAIGPQGNFGNIVYYFNQIRNKQKKVANSADMNVKQQPEVVLENSQP